jgi:dTDP-4-dehydrorhamnose 3,5-epimerase
MFSKGAPEMQFEHTEIPDVMLIRPKVFGDSRGSFLECWNEKQFAQGGLNLHFVQDNHSRSLQGTLRGLHYQVKQPQGKLVRVVSGTVFDVAVDLRRESPTYGRWVGATLSDENHQMLWIPPGFAHGFLVLSASADFLYKCTDFHAPEYERSIRWDDADLAIAWPLRESIVPILSAKDRAGVSFRDAEPVSL